MVQVPNNSDKGTANAETTGTATLPYFLKAREEFKLHKAALAKKRQRAANKNGKAK
jgi:hypothetical protein